MRRMTALLFSSEANTPRRAANLTHDEVAVTRAYQALMNARAERDYTEVKNLPRSDGQRLHKQDKVTRAADALQRATARLAKRQPRLMAPLRAALLASQESEYAALHRLVCLNPLDAEASAITTYRADDVRLRPIHDAGHEADAHHAIRELRRTVSRAANGNLRMRRA